MSPAFSFAGWDWRVWLARNKDALKTIVALAFGALTPYIASPPLPPALAAILAPLVALLSRFVADALDYWLTANPGDS